MNETKPISKCSPEFLQYMRQKGAKGGQSRSLRKLDSSRRNGAKGGRKPGKVVGPQMMVPPLNSIEVSCAKRCGFSMLLSQRAMELNTRGKAITLTCPDCGEFGTVAEPRTCPAPVMPPRPAAGP